MTWTVRLSPMTCAFARAVVAVGQYHNESDLDRISLALDLATDTDGLIEARLDDAALNTFWHLVSDRAALRRLSGKYAQQVVFWAFCVEKTLGDVFLNRGTNPIEMIARLENRTIDLNMPRQEGRRSAT